MLEGSGRRLGRGLDLAFIAMWRREGSVVAQIGLKATDVFGLDLVGLMQSLRARVSTSLF